MYKTKLFLDKTETKLKYNWPLNNLGVRGTDSPSSQKSKYNLYSQPSIWGSCSTTLFTIEKNSVYKWTIAVQTHVQRSTDQTLRMSESSL